MRRNSPSTSTSSVPSRSQSRLTEKSEANLVPAFSWAKLAAPFQRSRLGRPFLLPAALFFAAVTGFAAESPARKSEVAIVGEAFHINGKPTYAGRTWKGHKIEGLLLNSRVAQGIFDDLNPETEKLWAYPDTAR